MRLWKSWIIAKKDLSIIRRSPSIILIMSFPIILGIALPALTYYVEIKKHVPIFMTTELLASFAFFFLIMSALLPLYISSYSIVGEKIEKSLETLLATPTTDEEILMGKYIVAFLPMVPPIYLGTIIFMILSNLITGRMLYPNWTFGIEMLIGIPFAAMYGVSFGVLASSKSSSVQTAYQIGGISLIPLIVLYVMGEIDLISLTSIANISIISAGLLIADIFMYFISKATFDRRKILTDWKK